MDEPQQEMPPWRWPERLPTGQVSSRPSAGSPSVPPSDSQPQEPGSGGSTQTGESGKALALRSAVVTLASSGLSAAAAFGLHLDEARATALISFITATAAVVSLLMSSRDHA